MIDIDMGMWMWVVAESMSMGNNYTLYHNTRILDRHRDMDTGGVVDDGYGGGGIL